ncbi:secreted RxLR effector protein 161-like [Lathyrus oleraceus]|uniref:secreted RxLR effector protein 161-like n=1 Tax=Pisum sativum TaxID=3888 RepID=UPI0021D1B125|nr:secreted RxLR effector protein 161-like [Pisum sativum]
MSEDRLGDLRLDLAQAVNQVYKFMSKLGKQHWEEVKWILRYLKGTTIHSIMFNMEQNVSSIVGYVDSNYAVDLDDRKSTTEYVFTLAWRPICWKSSIQSIIVMSTIEAEYMVVYEAPKCIILGPNILMRGSKRSELVASIHILLQKVHSSENAIDMLTKSVTSEKFKYCLDLLYVS